MPLYDAVCPQHGKFETIARWDATIVCKQCGTESKRLLSMPAKMASAWHDNWSSGLSGSGFFSPSVGGRVANAREEERIMLSRGFVNEKDLGGESFYNGYTESKKEENRKLDAEAARYRENLKKFDGDKVRAVSETWSAKDMLQQAAEHDAKTA